MDYNKIVQGILDIGEAMLQSGAENFRLEDSFYRMCRSYGFKRSDVFVIPSNIQVTVETPEGEIITQIRHIESSEPNFDQLDYLNNLCRYVCQHTPDEKEMREKYLEVINREPQKRITRYAAGIMGGTGFAVYIGMIVLVPVIILAILGVQGESLFAFIASFFKFLKRRRSLSVPDERYRLEQSRKKERSERGGKIKREYYIFGIFRAKKFCGIISAVIHYFG